MEVRLIRHFATEGNLEKRYIGVTDEEIKTECVPEYTLKKEENGRYGKENGRAKWEPELVIVSPLRRCRQTAEILFPGVEQVVCDKMRECNFGLFEGKNYQELTGNPKYQSWIDSGGTKAFPGGEDPMEFRKRCVCGFEEMMEKMMPVIKEAIEKTPQGEPQQTEATMVLEEGQWKIDDFDLDLGL